MLEIVNYNKDEYNFPALVVLGCFDAVHVGHAELLKKAKLQAKINGLDLGVMMFENGKGGRQVYTFEERLAFLSGYNAKFVLKIDYNDEFKKTTPAEFLNILEEKINIKGYMSGKDFRFGAGAKGKSSTLKKYAEDEDNAVWYMPVKDVMIDGEKVSTTLIKQYLEEGKIQKANELLGREYFVSGEVCEGHGRGASVLGFPTANIVYPANKVLVAPGVYGVEAEIDGTVYKGVANCGPRPTFGEDAIVLEAYFEGLNENLYGKTLTVKFLNYIRGIKKFENADELKAQIASDATKVGEPDASAEEVEVSAPAAEVAAETPVEEPAAEVAAESVETPAAEEVPAEEPAPEVAEEVPAEEPAPEVAAESVETPAAEEVAVAETPAAEVAGEVPAEEPVSEVAEETPVEESAPEVAEEVPAEEPAPEVAEEVPAEEPAPEVAEESPVEEPAPEVIEEVPAEEPAPEVTGEVSDEAAEAAEEVAAELFSDKEEEPEQPAPEDEIAAFEAPSEEETIEKLVEEVFEGEVKELPEQPEVAEQPEAEEPETPAEESAPETVEETPVEEPAPEVVEEVPVEEPAPETVEETPEEEPAPEVAEEVPAEEPSTEEVDVESAGVTAEDAEEPAEEEGEAEEAEATEEESEDSAGSEAAPRKNKSRRKGRGKASRRKGAR